MKWQKTKKKSLSDESLNKGKPKNENPKDNKCINTKIGKIKKQSESEEGQALNLKKKTEIDLEIMIEDIYTTN